MSEYFVANTTMVIIECYKCHVLFAVPKQFNEKQLELKESGGFWCPNGHDQVYIGKSLKSKLQAKEKALKNLCSENSRLNECCINYKSEAEKNKRSVSALKGVITKLKK